MPFMNEECVREKKMFEIHISFSPKAKKKWLGVSTSHRNFAAVGRRVSGKVGNFTSFWTRVPTGKICHACGNAGTHVKGLGRQHSTLPPSYLYYADTRSIGHPSTHLQGCTSFLLARVTSLSVPCGSLGQGLLPPPLRLRLRMRQPSHRFWGGEAQKSCEQVRRAQPPPPLPTLCPFS